ncbi:MAG: LysR substrate-binding domain-containing protein [Rhodanobacteraceae bacterium]
MIRISPRQLEVFTAIAATGSVRGAADAVHLSQPAVSMALGELERQLGAPLFDRVGRRLSLNEHGMAVLPRAQEVLERLQELARAATGVSAPLSGELRVGASNTVGNYLVGDLLGGFVRAHPGVALQLAIANTEQIVADVRRFALDVGCVEGVAPHADIDTLPWRQDRLVVCVNPEHPLARRRRLAARDFRNLRWILRERGSATRALAERALSSLPPPEGVLELGQSEAIKQAVIAGLGVACLPEVAITDAVSAGRLRALHTPFLDLARRLSLVWHRERYRGPLLQAFIEMVSQPVASSQPARGARRR